MPGRVAVESVLDIHTPHVRMGHNGAVKGNFQEQKAHKLDHFTEFTNAKFWTANVGNGGNVPAMIAGANGLINIITNAGSSDVTELGGTTAMWYGQQAVVIEARFKATLVTSVALNFGLVNAVSGTNDKNAFQLASNGTATAGTNVVDAACFVFDTTMTSAKWRICSVKAGGTAQQATVTSAAIPVNGTFEVFRIAIDTDGNATFYRNGLVEGFLAAALAPANSLIPYISVLNNTTSARSITPDYIEIWQNVLETSSILW